RAPAQACAAATRREPARTADPRGRVWRRRPGEGRGQGRRTCLQPRRGPRAGCGLELARIVEEVGARPLLRCAVDVEDELVVALVPDLQRRPGLNRDDAQ